MDTSQIDRGALIAGALFVALGVLFLLDHYAVFDFRAIYVWPILLIGLGVAVMFGGRTRN